MTDERCSCCDLPIYSCGTAIAKLASDQERARRAQALALPGVVEAKYGGKCATCSERYPERTPIRRTTDGWSGVLCCPDVVGE